MHILYYLYNYIYTEELDAGYYYVSTNKLISMHAGQRHITCIYIYRGVMH